MTVPRLPVRPPGVEKRSSANRVDEADATAEKAWRAIPESPSQHSVAVVLRAIAAELRAQRIARRPGAGQ